MDAHTIGMFLVGGAGLAVTVWVLHKIGKALLALVETLAAVAVVFVALWWLLKALVWLLTQIVTRWRTSLTVLALAAWWHWWGWPSLAISLAVTALALTVWRWVDLVSFDTWAGRWLRAWWLRWTIYAPKLPGWLHACGLSITDTTTPVVVTVNLVGRQRIRRDQHQLSARTPRVLGVRSGASWDEVRVRLVAGQTSEDFDAVTRALACARGVARWQVRELTANVVSIDFQRHNLLTTAVACPDLATLAGVAGTAVDLGQVWAGRTEYGQSWYLPLTGSASHTLIAGASGAGKGSVMWCPLVSIAPAIRDGLVRVSGIDPKGMELAYGRGIFHRYAVTGAEALHVLDELIATMQARKAEFAGRVRTVPLSRERPLELLEFDEIGALTKYTDRKPATPSRNASRCSRPRAGRWESRSGHGVPAQASGPVQHAVLCSRAGVAARQSDDQGQEDRSQDRRGSGPACRCQPCAGQAVVDGGDLRRPAQPGPGSAPHRLLRGGLLRSGTASRRAGASRTGLHATGHRLGTAGAR